MFKCLYIVLSISTSTMSDITAEVRTITRNRSIIRKSTFW